MSEEKDNIRPAEGYEGSNNYFFKEIILSLRYTTNHVNITPPDPSLLNLNYLKQVYLLHRMFIPNFINKIRTKI